ncbi:MAG: flavin reductase family protein [candidate division Zixibacteria bacterium]|nr:flavin reductase family protein [candidate division Zixibacteria bacterium]
MVDTLKPIEVFKMTDNIFKLISTDWMLVTAGDIESYNTMTAAWGTFGELWSLEVCICYVRPTRYTYDFMEKSRTFTLSFFDEAFRDTLNYCGTKSGRDVDKMSIPELTAVKSKDNSVYFAEARLVVECSKIYTQDIDPERFLDSKIHDKYPKKDYHRMYVGEIIQCLTR